MMTKFSPEIIIEWNYFEANHGKGAVDGIGGRVKHAVFRKVLGKHVVIESPKHFAEYANSILPKIEVVYADEDQMELGFEDECREKAVYIPGTLKIHNVNRTVVENEARLSFYITTISEKELSRKVYEIGSSPQPRKSLEERIELARQKKEAGKERVKEKELRDEEKRTTFERCADECNCEGKKCLASGLRKCAVCTSVQKSKCKKKKCVGEDGVLPEMILPKCDRKLLVSTVYSDESSAGEDYSSNDERSVDAESNDDSMIGSEVNENAENFKVGDYVVIVKKPYKGYYAVITDKSYGDEWEIQYYEKRPNCYVLKENDLDSRDEEDMCKVIAEIDNQLRTTFKNIS